MLNKLFRKYECPFCVLLIVIYVVSNSYCVQNFGIADYRSGLINTIISVTLIILMKNTYGLKYYGIQKVDNKRKYLYFLPLIIIGTVNLWGGFDFSKLFEEVILHIWTMVNVGFIEEVLFRGFLFKMIARENVKKAIIISALTFGIGHIVNLLNGADLLPTLIQIIYAVFLGYLFVMIFYKSNSLLPDILTHMAINCLSVFNVGSDSYVSVGFLIVVSSLYALYISKLK